MDVNDVRIRTEVILQKKKHSASDAQTVNYVVNGLKNEKNLFWVILFYKAHSGCDFQSAGYFKERDNSGISSLKFTVETSIGWTGY